MSEDMVARYIFAYGPLMIFFLAVGFGIYRAGPAVLALLRDMVVALNNSTSALKNSTQALEASNKAVLLTHDSIGQLSRIFDELHTRMDRFECANAEPRKRTRVTIKSPPAS